jgi:hypothetical protein
MRPLIYLLLLVLTLAAFQAKASDLSLCAYRQKGPTDSITDSLHQIRIASDLKRNIGAAIDPSFGERTAAELEELSEIFIDQIINNVSRIGTLPDWTSEPPYFGLRAGESSFVVLVAEREGETTLFRSDRLMHLSELAFTLGFFFDRTLGDCSLALGDPEFSSLYYKHATIAVAHWCDTDGKWYKSKICSKEPLYLEIQRFEDSYRAVKAQAADLSGSMDAFEAYFTHTTLMEWTGYLSELKDFWCEAYENQAGFCAN